jgi:hypothetical protein
MYALFVYVSYLDTHLHGVVCIRYTLDVERMKKVHSLYRISGVLLPYS